ncbi:inositol monophosphatase family protein [Bacillus toyonensis]
MQEVWKDIDAHAKRWIRDAGERLMASLKQALIIEMKSNAADLVTNMDREIEQYLIGKIKETFPTHNILGEEGYGDEITSSDGVVWLIDPIDGTMNFVHQKEISQFQLEFMRTVSEKLVLFMILFMMNYIMR